MSPRSFLLTQGLFNETGSQVSTGRSTASKKTVVNFGPLFLSLVNSHPHLHAEHTFGTHFFFYRMIKRFTLLIVVSKPFLRPYKLSPTDLLDLTQIAKKAARKFRGTSVTVEISQEPTGSTPSQLPVENLMRGLGS